jgi:hypothetical protein
MRLIYQERQDEDSTSKGYGVSISKIIISVKSKAHIKAGLGILALNSLKNKVVNLCISEEGSVS